MLQHFKHQLNYKDVIADLHDVFEQDIEPEDEDDILDEEDYLDEQYEIEDDEEEILRGINE